MLSHHTAHQFKDFLLAVGNGELSVENLRQQLAHNREFEAFSVFVRLDRAQDGVLDAHDIADFLRGNGHSYGLADVTHLVRYFDIDGDGALNYTEFLQMILPCDNLTLRSQAA